MMIEKFFSSPPSVLFEQSMIQLASQLNARVQPNGLIYYRSESREFVFAKKIESEANYEYVMIVKFADLPDILQTQFERLF